MSDHNVDQNMIGVIKSSEKHQDDLRYHQKDVQGNWDCLPMMYPIAKIFKSLSVENNKGGPWKNSSVKCQLEGGAFVSYILQMTLSY